MNWRLEQADLATLCSSPSAYCDRTQKLAAVLSYNNRQLAFHRFDRQPECADYWRDKLDEIEWPTQQASIALTEKNPDPRLIVASREAVQVALGCGITSAQDWCAEQLHTSRRAWQQWERGERAMPPAFWELHTIKYAMLNAHTKK